MQITITTNLDELLTRIDQVIAALPQALEEAMSVAGEELRQQLADAAPQGTGAEGSPPAGDAAGRLAESFMMEAESDGASVRVVISTTQPQKLEWVRYGTGIYGPMGGRIYPRIKRALFWQGAAHPVRSIAGMAPNDFVSPVLDGASALFSTQVETAISEVVMQL